MDWDRLDGLLASGDAPAALELAVEAWRTRKCAAFANLVDAIAAQVPSVKKKKRERTAPAKFEPPAQSPTSPEGIAALMEKRRAARTARPDDPWPADVAAASAAELGALLATFPRAPEVGSVYLDPVELRQAAWFARLAALRARPADPRIATALVASLREARISMVIRSDAGVCYAPVLAHLEELADERAIAALQDLLAHPVSKRAIVRDYLAEAIPVTLAKLVPSPPLTPADAERCAAIIGVPEAAPATRDDTDLLAQVLANPADDGPRTVLADVWIERGDPRGELISVQLAGGTPSRTLIRRADELLGELALVSVNRIYERGFLAAIELRNNAAAAASVWATAAASPHLATVHTIDKGSANETLYRSFVMSPHARSLARVKCVSKAMLAELCATPPPALRELELVHGVDRKLLRDIGVAMPKLAKLSFVVRSRAAVDALKLTRPRTQPRHDGTLRVEITP